MRLKPSRRLRWAALAAVGVVAASVFVFSSNDVAEPPLTVEELAFVGDWLESHPNGTVSTLHLSPSRNAYLVHKGRRIHRGPWYLERGGSMVAIYKPLSLIQFDESFGQNWTRIANRVKSWISKPQPTVVSFPVHPTPVGRLLNHYSVSATNETAELVPMRYRDHRIDDPEIHVFCRTKEASKRHDDRQIEIWNDIAKRLDEAIAARKAISSR